MIRHRCLRLLGLALASALAWSLAPGDASADRDRGDRHGREYRERGHDRDRWDRNDRSRYDRWDRNDRSDWRRFQRDHRPRQVVRYDRHASWDRRFVRHDLRHVRSPFYCSAHRHGFRTQAHFHDHLTHFHGVPYWYVPRVVTHIGFGWTFGH